VVDVLFVIIELVSLFLMVETLYAKICRIPPFSKGVGHFQRKFQTERSVACQPLLVSEKESDYPFVRYQKFRSVLHCVIINQRYRRTDGQTDRRHAYDISATCILACRAKNCKATTIVSVLTFFYALLLYVL